MHQKNFRCLTTFSKTHRQTQRMYFWIGLDLTKVKKNWSGAKRTHKFGTIIIFLIEKYGKS